MIIEMRVIRQRSRVLDKATFGQWFIGDAVECYTLEDTVREKPGQPVASWKIKGTTAIPSGRYRLTLEKSRRFGDDTITVNNVLGFDLVRVHSVETVEDTDGCIGVGDTPNKEQGTMHGGIAHGVLKRLKAKIKDYIDRGDEVWLTVNNPKVM